MDDTFDWDRSQMLEIILTDKENFLKIKESLTRIGVLSKKTNTLYQSAHVLHKRGKYYICHFKEIFRLNGKHSDITYDDIERRNAIASLIEEWGLCEIKWTTDNYDRLANLSFIKILSHKDKYNYTLESKVTVGNVKK